MFILISLHQAFLEITLFGLSNIVERQDMFWFEKNSLALKNVLFLDCGKMEEIGNNLKHFH